MREAEIGLRSRLRFLQVARLDGWDVALQYISAAEGVTDDPLLVEARKRAAQGKKEREADYESPAKKRNRYKWILNKYLAHLKMYFEYLVHKLRLKVENMGTVNRIFQGNH